MDFCSFFFIILRNYVILDIFLSFFYYFEILGVHYLLVQLGSMQCAQITKKGDVGTSLTRTDLTNTY